MFFIYHITKNNIIQLTLERTTFHLQYTDIISGSKFECLVEVNDYFQTALAIEKLYQERHKEIHIVERVTDYYTVDTVTPKLREVYLFE